MKLSNLKSILANVPDVNFKLQNGTAVPKHFHITEVGEVTKNFIDCGGVVRKETCISLQLWNADDFDHRLKPTKLLDIIAKSENVLGIGDQEVEVEYQSDTIGRYDLDFDGVDFVLVSKQTDCLALDQCGVEKPKVRLSSLKVSSGDSCCDPSSNCCN